jgi:hypothetical protein
LELFSDLFSLLYSPLLVGFLFLLQLSVLGAVGFSDLVQFLFGFVNGALFRVEFGSDIVDFLWEFFHDGQQGLDLLEVEFSQALGL